MSPPLPPPLRLPVEPADQGARLDQFVSRRLPGVGRRGAARLVASGAVTIERAAGGRAQARPQKGATLAAGDVVVVTADDATLARAVPVDAPPLPRDVPGVEVVYRDEALLVLCKPAGVPSHPLSPDEAVTVANHLALLDPACLTVGGPAREGGLCHRLDTLTSGLLVAARTPEAYRELRARFTTHAVSKGYLALVHGDPPERGEVDRPIGSRRGRRRVVVGTGLAARTAWTRLERLGAAALVEVETHHGRRHQVRAHLAHAGHPLVEDTLYGGKRLAGWARGPLLHAHRLTLEHPLTGEALRLEAPLSSAQQEALARLRDGEE